MALPGVQGLVALLLTVPFSPGSNAPTSALNGPTAAWVLLAAVATVLLVAPTAGAGRRRARRLLTAPVAPVTPQAPRSPAREPGLIPSSTSAVRSQLNRHTPRPRSPQRWSSAHVGSPLQPRSSRPRKPTASGLRHGDHPFSGTSRHQRSHVTTSTHWSRCRSRSVRKVSTLPGSVMGGPLDLGEVIRAHGWTIASAWLPASQNLLAQDVGMSGVVGELACHLQVESPNWASAAAVDHQV